MKNQDLHSSSDEQIRNLLSKMKVGYDKNSWSALEKKMDSISSIEQTDRVFKDSLSGFEANYIPSSWSLLQYKMDYLIYNRRHLIGLKITELAIVCLLFWFWWGIETPHTPIASGELTKTTEQNLDVTSSEDELYKDSEITQTSHPDMVSSSTSSTPSQGVASSSIPNQGKNRKNGTSNDGKNSSKNVPPIGPQETAGERSETAVLPAESPSAGMLTELQPSSTALYIITNPLDGLNFRVQSIEKDEFIIGSPIDQPTEAPKPVIINAPLKKPLQYWIAGAISYDKDLIRTPFPSQQSVNHLGRIERNYHGEVNLFVSNGMLEFQTGIGFWAKEYSSVHNGINDAMVISIPANLRLRLSERGFMRGYLMGGLSTHFVAYANYRETSYFAGLDNTDIIQNNYQARASTIFSSTGFDHGILEGESVKGNQYFTVNMGIGVDIPLNSKFSLYLEQVYFHHLDGGIGPAFDKFSTSSTIVGIRYLLNKKSLYSGLNF